jgi:hypothetical protein
MGYVEGLIMIKLKRIYVLPEVHSNIKLLAVKQQKTMQDLLRDMFGRIE